MRIKHKYGCMMADGGKVKKPKMKPPKSGGKPKRITTPGKPGDSGPGGAHPGRNPPKRKKLADGGPIRAYGAPLGPTPKPGGTTRVRPKPGDKDPNYKPRKPRKPPTSSKPVKPKKPGPDYPHRDYRGTRGAIDDASGVKK